MKTTVGMKITKHELVTEKDDDGAEYDMLKVGLRGIDDKKTKCEILMAPEFKNDFPLGDKGTLRFEISQTRMDLDDARPSKGRAPKPAH